MMTPILRGACIGILLASAPLMAEDDLGCRFAKKPVETRQLAGHVIWLARVPYMLPSGVEDIKCQAALLAPDGRTIFSAQDWTIRVHEVTGKDLDRDGHPEAVLEGYSGGMHCCWTFWILSLKSPAKLLSEIHNEYLSYFEDIDGDGQMEIRALDGGFDYFDGLPHVGCLCPETILRFKDGVLRDVSSRFWPRYQKQISEARRALNPRTLGRFVALKDICMVTCSDPPRDPVKHWPTGNERVELVKTKSLVLTIVLANLYGGRQEEAWKALDTMWPASDKGRIRRLILEARACGVLNSVYSSCPPKQAN